MFGFGGKKKKMIKQFIDMTKAVMAPYIMMRAIGSYKFKDTKLEPLAIQILEGCFIYGAIDSIAHGIDLDEGFIDKDLILDACINCSIGMEIFDESEATRVFQDVLFLVEEGNAAHELMYKGAKSAQACLDVMFDGQGSEGTKFMNPNYVDDKDLVKRYKELFDLQINDKKN